jgi:hypothetical protein
VSDFFYVDGSDSDNHTSEEGKEDNLILFPSTMIWITATKETILLPHRKKENYGNTFEQKQEQDDELYSFFRSYLFPAVCSPLLTSQKEKRIKPRTESSFYDLYSILKYFND